MSRGMDVVRPKAERWFGWLIFSVFTLIALHTLVFYSVAPLNRLRLAAIRDPKWPFDNPWILVGDQVVAVVWFLLSRGPGLRTLRYAAFWTSFIGLWFFFRIEDLLAPFGVSLTLTILTFIDLRRSAASIK